MRDMVLSGILLSVCMLLHTPCMAGTAPEGVKVAFDYTRMPTHASNQMALWVEDGDGKLVKTIFITDFTAGRRGYQVREDALNHWVEAADPAAMEDEDIDAISSATPQEGHLEYDWDLTDNKGNPVPDGKYVVKLEGTLFWDSNVLYTARIDLEDSNPEELEVLMERSRADVPDNADMIQNVVMVTY